MCGLILYVSKDNKSKEAGEHILNQFQDQIHRGKEGFGLIEINKDGVKVLRATEITKATIDAKMAQSSLLAFHHRYPTSTENKISQTHPFLVSHDELEHDLWVMHNGVISNALELSNNHLNELGYAYSSIVPGKENFKSTDTLTYGKNKPFNDSEALAVEVARYFSGKSTQIEAQGTIAFFAIKMCKKTGKPLQLLWGRNAGNPLECLETTEGMLIASAIDNKNAETIKHNSYEVLDIQKYFKSKAKSQDVYNEVKQGDITFAKATEVTRQVPVPVSSTTLPRQVGLRAPSNTQGYEDTSKKKTSQTTLSDSDFPSKEDNKNEGWQTPRERAFETMAERTINEMTEGVYDFFETLAYSQVEEKDVADLVNQFEEMLIEKTERASSVVRPHFDKMENKETQDIIDKEVLPFTYTDEEDEMTEEEAALEESRRVSEGYSYLRGY